jgi:esterase/lipase superfamily enzyme
VLHEDVRDLLRAFLTWAVLPALGLAAVGYYAEKYLIPKPYAGVTLEENVVYVSARRFETKGLEALRQEAPGISLDRWASLLDTGAIGSDVIVLVHGYNAQEQKVSAYFAGLIATLRNNPGRAGTIIVFDWPAVGIPHDELPTTVRMQREMFNERHNSFSQPSYELAAYAMDQRRAGDVGARSFVAMLASLAGTAGRRITVVGHSMGCHLLLHALRQDPKSFGNVDAIYWLAPDVDVAALKDPAFIGAVESLTDGLFVHYSTNDSVLTGLSRVANLTHRIGAAGPGAEPIATPKLHFVDMTAALGADNVHDGYLRKGSESARLIAAHLDARRSLGAPLPEARR